MIHEAAVPRGLFEAVLARIDRARRHSAQLRVAIRSVLGLCSLLVLIPAIQYAGAQFAASGFFSYLSLFLDGSVVTTYWRDLSLSLLDSLPSIALIAVLVPAGVLAWAVVGAARSARRAFRFA